MNSFQPPPFDDENDLTMMWISKKLLFLLPAMGICFYSYSNKKWDGGGGDGRWETALNWSDDQVPGPTDVVILDNSIVVTNYQVIIVGSSGSANCQKLIISPDPAFSIQLMISPLNLQPIALATSGSGYIIELFSGAILVNSSGASSGSILQLSDSFKINNGGRYIHRTARAHAAILDRISVAQGTELGIVEFDVPAVSGSYIVSLTGRTLGSLVLSSDAHAAPLTYSSSGIRQVNIRGNLKLNPQVTFTIGFNDTIKIKGNLDHAGTVFNLSNNGNATVLQLEGNLVSTPGSVITETSTAKPVMLLAGAQLQEIRLEGTIINEIILTMLNEGNAVLRSPLSLPYLLNLKSGRLLTSSINLLTLGPNCGLIVDSATSNKSFIQGPLQKLGLMGTGHFLFPVGKQNNIRWVALKNAKGDFTVEFFNSSPYSFGSTMNDVDHISSLEYWTISGPGSASASVELSFNNVNSGGVTSLNFLRVAHLANETWTNRGNTGVTGSAGASGSVISETINGFNQEVFTLASSMRSENPLPVTEILFNARQVKDSWQIFWQIPTGYVAEEFRLEFSSDRLQCTTFKTFAYDERKYSYRYDLLKAEYRPGWYRVRAVVKNGDSIVSRWSFIQYVNDRLSLDPIGNVLHDALTVRMYSPTEQVVSIILVNTTGKIVFRRTIPVHKGKQDIRWSLIGIPPGIYHLVGYAEGAAPMVSLMIKL